ncbi:cytochrome P450 [Pelagibacterium lacus]|uniref:Cytochrome P450 n=1 Tax=Pelagibacterium lacus TaxID=2282655 RepID=A0A369VZ01_9HYPH|nr:cytochrome P450 [Pelagibacterium lacus]RDE07626.1 cytochrome P450 [Pelagibacterium lacus]
MKTFDLFDRPANWATAANAFRDDFERDDRIQVAPWGGYAILGYGELLELARNPAVDGMAPDPQAMANTPHVYTLLARALFTKAGPEHRAERSATIAAFNGVDIPMIVAEAAADTLPATAADLDVMSGIVRPMVRDIWARVIGYNDDEAAKLETAVEHLGYVLSSAPDAAEADRADAAAQRVRELSLAVVERGSAFADVLRQKLDRNLAADLIAGMAFDALETSSVGIMASLRIAARNADRLQPTAKCADECLRLASPTPFTMRQTTSAVRAGDVEFPSGTTLSMVWAAGNHDPSTFAAPATFDPDRERLRPLSFGAGPHACLGLGIMRASLQHLLAFMVERRPMIKGELLGWYPFNPAGPEPLTISV